MFPHEDIPVDTVTYPSSELVLVPGALHLASERSFFKFQLQLSQRLTPSLTTPDGTCHIVTPTYPGSQLALDACAQHLRVCPDHPFHIHHPGDPQKPGHWQHLAVDGLEHQPGGLPDQRADVGGFDTHLQEREKPRGGGRGQYSLIIFGNAMDCWGEAICRNMDALPYDARAR